MAYDEQPDPSKWVLEINWWGLKIIMISKNNAHAGES